MTFNSLAFLIFLPIVYMLYWCLPFKKQNWLLWLGSYIFYGWWDWRFLSLILISTLVDYLVAIKIDETSSKSKKKQWSILSLITNIGLLGFFKYFNFFAESLQEMVQSFGVHLDPLTLNIILPAGISFYTFQTLSYTIDIYYQRFKPTRDFVAFAAFVSFFPQLVAGPIERARNLLPQFYKARRVSWEEFSDGCRLMIWGFFKKLVIADNLAIIVDQGYQEGAFGGLSLIATYAFAFQIYADFSGYSDIARGCARIFGIDIMVNFKTPYFSSSLPEFWQRWHISLSTWFRDYVYIPLGGNRYGQWIRERNLLVTFVTSGLWHGNNGTFLIWGLYHGLIYLPCNWIKNKFSSSKTKKISGPFSTMFQVFLTFHLVAFGWIFFRAESLVHAKEVLTSIFSYLLNPSWFVIDNGVQTFTLLLVFIVFDWFSRNREHPLQIQHFHPLIRWLIEYSVIAAIFVFGQLQSQSAFIYFQF